MNSNADETDLNHFNISPFQSGLLMRECLQRFDDPSSFSFVLSWNFQNSLFGSYEPIEKKGDNDYYFFHLGKNPKILVQSWLKKMQLKVKKIVFWS